MASPASRPTQRFAGDSSLHIAATPPLSMKPSSSMMENPIALDSSPLAQAATWGRVSLKRRYPIPLPLDEADLAPHKKSKPLLTSASVRRKPELEDLHAMRLLELVRATRATFAVHAKYQRLRLKELELIHAMAIDECEEAESRLKEVEWQAGEVKNAVVQDGPGLLSHTCGLFLKNSGDSLDVASVDDLSGCEGSGPSNHNHRSPTPSIDSSSEAP